jgi:hypothetical protein
MPRAFSPALPAIQPDTPAPAVFFQESIRQGFFQKEHAGERYYFPAPSQKSGTGPAIREVSHNVPVIS